MAKEWVKNADGVSGDDKDLIIVHMLPKYGVRIVTGYGYEYTLTQDFQKPAGARAAGTPSRRVAKRSFATMESEEVNTPAPPSPVDRTLSCLIRVHVETHILPRQPLPFAKGDSMTPTLTRTLGDRTSNLSAISLSSSMFVMRTMNWWPPGNSRKHCAPARLCC